MNRSAGGADGSDSAELPDFSSALGRRSARFERKIDVPVREGWEIRDSATISSQSGDANVIFSSEAVEPWLTTHEYAESLRRALAAEFPEIRELEHGPTSVFGGHSGYRTVFERIATDGTQIHQIQLYLVDDGRGYTATATVAAHSLPLRRAELVGVLSELRLAGSGETPSGSDRVVPDEGAFGRVLAVGALLCVMGAGILVLFLVVTTILDAI